MASLSFRIRGLPADLRLDATYQSHGANDALKSDLRVAFAADGDEHVKLLGLSLDLSRSLLSGHPFRPYLLAGAGVSRSSVSITAGAVKGGSSGTAFAWNLGGGILYQLRKVALLMEGRFVSIGSAAGLPRITVVPIVIGLRFGNR
jgi:opacity protein-like surface antigen